MIRGIFAFLIGWVIVSLGISLFWHSTRTEKVDFFKAAGYGLMTAVIALWLLVGIVYIF